VETPDSLPLGGVVCGRGAVLGNLAQVEIGDRIINRLERRTVGVVNARHRRK
jgi:hypothetical protein